MEVITKPSNSPRSLRPDLWLIAILKVLIQSTPSTIVAFRSPSFVDDGHFQQGLGNGSLNMQHSDILLNFGAAVTREVMASLGSHKISHTKLRDSLRIKLDGSKLIN